MQSNKHLVIYWFFVVLISPLLLIPKANSQTPDLVINEKSLEAFGDCYLGSAKDKLVKFVDVNNDGAKESIILKLLNKKFKVKKVDPIHKKDDYTEKFDCRIEFEISLSEKACFRVNLFRVGGNYSIKSGHRGVLDVKVLANGMELGNRREIINVSIPNSTKSGKLGDLEMKFNQSPDAPCNQENIPIELQVSLFIDGKDTINDKIGSSMNIYKLTDINSGDFEEISGNIQLRLVQF